MKRVWLMVLLLGCVGLFGGAGPGMASLSIGEDMKINAIGDAVISINLSLTAAQYANWNAKYGQDPSLLKRDVGKVVSQYDTYDWDVKSDAMNRQVTISVKAHGLVTHRGNGLYEFDVPKSWKGGERSGNSIDYNYIDSGSGVIEQFSCKVNLPPEAKDIKDETGESGQRVLRYSVPVASTTAGKWIVLSLGGLIALGGVGIMGIGLVVGLFFGGKKRKAATGV